MKFTNEWLKEYEARNQRPTDPKPEPTVLDGALAEEEVEGRDPRRRVTVTSYRVRLLDQDNLCVKYHIDGLRYNGVIKDDTTEDIEIFVHQHKVKTRKEERTEIEVA